jgi:hypothetical protein
MLSGQMTTIVLVGVASALALAAVVVKARAGRVKKADKWEKAQIVKRLVALSERENMVKGMAGQQSVSQSPVPCRRAAAGRGALTL